MALLLDLFEIGGVDKSAAKEALMVVAVAVAVAVAAAETEEVEPEVEVKVEPEVDPETPGFSTRIPE
jgi:hypothetical protein